MKSYIFQFSKFLCFLIQIGKSRKTNEKKNQLKKRLPYKYNFYKKCERYFLIFKMKERDFFKNFTNIANKSN